MARAGYPSVAALGIVDDLLRMTALMARGRSEQIVGG